MDVQDYKSFGFRPDKTHKSKKPAKKIYSMNYYLPLTSGLFLISYCVATYLKQGAERELNLPESMRAVIGERLNEPTISMFDEAQAEVLSLMRSDSFSVCLLFPSLLLSPI